MLHDPVYSSEKFGIFLASDLLSLIDINSRLSFYEIINFF